MNSCMRHCSMVGLSSGDHLTIHSTNRTMLFGAPFSLSFRGARGLFPSKFEKSNSWDRSHFCMGKKLLAGNGRGVRRGW